jgi:dynein heavy chain
VEGVNELVQVAQEELKVETKLRAIEEFWRVSVFDFVRHRDTEVYIINSPDVILEALEEHSLQVRTQTPTQTTYISNVCYGEWPAL